MMHTHGAPCPVVQEFIMDKSPGSNNTALERASPVMGLPQPSGSDSNESIDLGRFWTEWFDAGRLWMSWWMNSLPTMPWPPAGMLVPPPLPERPLHTEAGSAENTPIGTAGQLNAQTVKHLRTTGNRHH
jgi:hypothetical protein